MVIQENVQKLYQTLCEVEGLTEDEYFHALRKIAVYPTKMLVIYNLPSSVRLD
ncbi:hypothetical protein Gogos_018047, partial [Gossypium gossypioides]|nr:hypothetical protein [Gossypium gossypioides]